MPYFSFCHFGEPKPWASRRDCEKSSSSAKRENYRFLTYVRNDVWTILRRSLTSRMILVSVYAENI